MIKKLMLEKADRLFHLPPVLDDFLPRKSRKKLLGQEIIDLARFNWPGPKVEKAISNGDCLATDEETAALMEKTAAWYRARYGIKVLPAKEIFIGGNIRQILGLLALAFFDPSDIILIPDPGIWHYRAAAVLASAETVPYHVSEKNGFKPVISSISNNLARMAKAMILNRPHNPSGALIGKEDLHEILHLAGRDNLMLILDQAFDGFAEDQHPTSLFALPGGRKVALELYSFAYNFGRPLPSIGFAVGQPALISGLRGVAKIMGHSLTQHQVQLGLAACENPNDGLDEMRIQFARNRDVLDQLCQKIRLFPAEHRSGPYYWAKLPGRKQSRRFCRNLYLQCGVLAVPGVAFGENGEGYIRFSLTAPYESCQRALEASNRMFQPLRERKAADG
ncbi:MAG: aminotransferase class I/II-fold pyridoxal phosphate-dependent enzyme [FCB group bacterium]|nr:aminotransferase class I/II-fold pyridoxal phosphate-dependent enzyme [FCB group bacterium]